jgi:hypothetical protein
MAVVNSQMAPAWAGKPNLYQIETIAGDGNGDYSGNGGLATSAKINNPYGVTLDASNNIYIGDFNNNVVRVVPTISGTLYGQAVVAGGIYAIAGNGTGGYSGDNGRIFRG